MLRLVGIIPIAIGLMVIGFAWTDVFTAERGVMPLVFRALLTLFGLAAGVFVGIGFLIGIPGLQKSEQPAMCGKALLPMPELQLVEPARRVRNDGYICPSCNAPIGRQSDVSPLGDAKCAHCGRWFNVHA